MYLRKLNYKEEQVSDNHSGIANNNKQKLLMAVIFGIIIIFSILLSSLNEAEINIL